MCYCEVLVATEMLLQNFWSGWELCFPAASSHIHSHPLGFHCRLRLMRKPSSPGLSLLSSSSATRPTPSKFIQRAFYVFEKCDLDGVQFLATLRRHPFCYLGSLRSSTVQNVTGHPMQPRHAQGPEAAVQKVPLTVHISKIFSLLPFSVLRITEP